MTIHNIFDKIYVISLKTEHQRQINISQELQKMGIEFEFLEAEEPVGLPVKNKQIVGNRMSHLKAILKGRNKKYKNVLVLEDDIAIDNHHHNNNIILKEISHFINNNKWSCLYLGGRHQIVPRKLDAYKHIVKPIRVIGTHAIAYNLTNCNNIIRLYSIEQDIDRPIDYVLSGDSNDEVRLLQNNFVINQPCYACYPLFIYQKTGYNINKELIKENYWHERF